MTPGRRSPTLRRPRRPRRFCGYERPNRGRVSGSPARGWARTRVVGPQSGRSELTDRRKLGGRLGRTHIVGAGLFAKYAPTHGRTQPYLLGGLGAQYLTQRNHRAARTGATDGDGTTPETSWTASRTSPAISGGLGVLTSFGPAAHIVEGRYTFLPNGGAHIRKYIAPVTIGVRF